MRLTKQTNYAIRILMYCAANEPRLSRVQEISQANGVSEAFLFKILKLLVSGGFVETVRGRYGGVHLARRAEEITLLDVVRVTEEAFIMAECFEDEHADCPLVNACELNRVLREALNAFFETLSKYTLADLIDTPDDFSRRLGIDPLGGPLPAVGGH